MAPFRSLKFRIALTIFLLEAVMMAVALWLTSGAQTEALRRQQVAARNAVMELGARVSRTALLTDELNELRFYFDSLQRDPGVERVLLGNPEGTIVASAVVRDLGQPMPALEAAPEAEWRTVAIDNAAGALGVLAVRFSSRELLQAQAQARRLGLAVAAVGMTVIALVGLAIGVLMTRRLGQLADAAGRMAQGDRSARARLPGRDEVAVVGRAFDAMADAVAQQESQLLAERETTRLLLTSTAEAIYAVDLEGHCSFANPACGRLLGAGDPSALLGRPATGFHGTEAASRIGATTASGLAWYGEDQVRRIDGSSFPADVWSHPIVRDGQRLGAVVTFVDTTERKRAEAELLAERNLSTAIFGNAGAVMLVLDREGRIRRFNRAAELLSGRSFREVEGQRPWDVVLPPEVADEVRTQAFEALANDPRRMTGRYTNEWLDGRGGRRLIDWTNTLIFDPQGEMAYMIAIGIDVTDKHAADERIRQTLREKELLLREIYHRVKNNLQMVVSLLALQSRNTATLEARSALQESARRIKSMALVHEQLYQSGDLSAIDFAHYLGQLVHHVIESQGESSQRVPVRVEAGHFTIGIETAVPLGLIVNELVTNAYKHAFPGRRRGSITVSLQAIDGGQLELRVADDGVGLPPGFEPAAASSLGMRLVLSLAAQIEGVARYTEGYGGGCVFTLRFRPELREPQRLGASPTPR